MKVVLFITWKIVVHFMYMYYYNKENFSFEFFYAINFHIKIYLWAWQCTKIKLKKNYYPLRFKPTKFLRNRMNRIQICGYTQAKHCSCSGQLPLDHVILAVNFVVLNIHWR